MDYPPHKSQNIVSRYLPMIVTALAAWPEVSEFEPDGVKFSTFVARFRDSIAALQQYEYEGADFTLEELGKLELLKTRTVANKLLVGSAEALKLYNSSPAGQLTRTNTIGLVRTVDAPTKELLEAIEVCLRNGVFVSMNITGLTADAVRAVLKDVEITELNNELILYYGR